MESLIISEMKSPWAGDLEAEIVERKGLGHPDSICDSLAEELSGALCGLYLEKFDSILHHNVDKILLAGGASRPRFGGGEITAPIEIFLVGRATGEYRGVSLPLEDLAHKTVRKWFRRNIPMMNARDLKIHCLWRPVSPDLADLFSRPSAEGPLANDTSIGVGFAPLSSLESIVLGVEQKLNSPRIKEEFPEYGPDVKVMGIRRKDAIELTVPCALVDRYVSCLDDYLEKKLFLESLIGQWALPFSPVPVAVEVNTADSGESLYLTVTGTSAESGDDGEVGRGNRFNGLITPYRPMTMEAFAGKNPVTHTGKLYQRAAQRIAERLAEMESVAAAECYLVSRIGRPIREPQIIDVRLKTRDGKMPPFIDRIAANVAREELENLSEVWKEFLPKPAPAHRS